MRNELTAREYKLLLDPAKFPDPLTKDTANRFWEQKLKPIIANRVDKRADGSPRASNDFDRLRERLVRFWDTSDCALTSAEFALRSRMDVKDGKVEDNVAEITLKLRMSDYFVVGDTDLPGFDSHAETKFEEDIAPLEIKPADPASPVIFPVRFSTRSRYALSTTQSTEWNGAQRVVANLRKLFPTLEGNLNRPLDADDALIAGKPVRELAAKGAEVKLGDGVNGRFTLTFWYFDRPKGPPDIAELSFKCDTLQGEMPGKAARRALDLFIGFQSDLGDYVNTDHASKTAIALPEQCASIG